MKNNEQENNVKELSQEKSIVMTETELHELLDGIQEEIQQTILHSEKFSGPVPHPNHMKQYKIIDKSLPHRFTKMAEDNLSHRQSMEKLVTKGELIMSFLGWLTPTGISFYSIYTASELIQDGKSIEALVSLIAALATLGGAFYMKQKVDNK
ncbi:MAG: hypothetical protein COA39_012350 [Sulfurimonas sp.]|nr:hypothetical protein [Sulfurimonas sp.]